MSCESGRQVDCPHASELGSVANPWIGSRLTTGGFERRVGLLAGAGRFPVRFCEAAIARGHEVVCVGIRGLADEVLRRLSTVYHEVGIAKLGRMIRLFKRHRVRQLVLAGKVYKHRLFDRWRVFRYLPDLRTIRFYLWSCRGNRKDDRMLLAVIDEFEAEGIQVRSALEICPELLARPGLLSTRSPNRREWEDIRFGWRLAKEMGRLDVGQSVAVRDCATLAVEAIEGTDRAIERAGQLCRLGGFVVVKVAKPQQDVRFDVPTVGPNTIRTLHKAGGTVLAIEAHKTILLDESETLGLANELGISVVAVTEEMLEADCHGA